MTNTNEKGKAKRKKERKKNEERERERLWQFYDFRGVLIAPTPSWEKRSDWTGQVANPPNKRVAKSKMANSDPRQICQRKMHCLLIGRKHGDERKVKQERERRKKAEKRHKKTHSKGGLEG